MKKYIISLLAVLAVFAGTSFADSNISKDRLELAEKAYKASLKSDNAGVRNSALYRIAVLKSVAPEFDTSEYSSILKNMSNKDHEAHIRVNARLTLDVLGNTNLLKDVDTESVDPNEFFNGIYMKVADLYAAN